MQEANTLGGKGREERGEFFWKVLAIALLVALAGSWAVKARADLPYPERVRARTVEAQEIVLKDSEGQVRARFSVQGAAAKLVIFDEHGKTLAVLPQQPRMKEVGE